MTLGRTSAGKIKIKTDGDDGLRAVECGCCASCNGCSSLSGILSASRYEVLIHRQEFDEIGNTTESTFQNAFVEIPIGSCIVEIMSYGQGGTDALLFITSYQGPCNLFIGRAGAYKLIPFVNGQEINIIGAHSLNYEYTREVSVSPNECAAMGGSYFWGEDGAPDACYIQTVAATETFTFS
jgi:hypothetical protein